MAMIHWFIIISLAVIVYVYFGYPALLWLLTRRVKNGPVQTSAPLPSLSLIITAYNEETVMEQKLINALALEYPGGRLEVIVASDGSDDGTDEIVARYADRGIRLHRLPERRGKLPAVASAVEEAMGEILVFSDANAMYEPDALMRLVEPFQDEAIGCVCGKLLYENPEGTAVSEGETLYWNYENRLKQWESRFNSLIGANGSIYALRREAYVPLDADVSDDYGFPLAAYARGYRVVYQESAVSREEAPDKLHTEFKKKVRSVAHQLTTLARLWPILRPYRDPKLMFQLVSHKLLRNIIPFFLICILASSLAVEGPPGRILLWAQFVFYGLAVCGLILYRWRLNFRLFAVPMYFCAVNAAAAVGVVQFFRGVNYAAWDERRNARSRVPTG